MSPIRMVNASSAFSASSMLICTITRLLGSMVVSHSCSGFISPRPLYRLIFAPGIPAESAVISLSL